jgi:quercetin dioxygenase-like cupin family protein
MIEMLEPHTQGPGSHSHPEDDVFYVIEGTMSVLVGEEWTHATRGAFILCPAALRMTLRIAATRARVC